MFKKTIYLVLLLVVLSACKSTKSTTGFTTTSMSSKKVVKKHYKVSFDKETINASIKIKYKDANRSQSVSLKMRMQTDSAIWMSARFLGIPMAKIYMTPNSVSYYEKIGKTYFKGDFTLLSDFLGTEVDFQMIQNLLLGQAIESLKGLKLDSEIYENTYQLEPKDQQLLYDILFWVNPINFKMSKQEIRQPLEQKKLTINYLDYQDVSGVAFPKHINITAVDNDEKVFIGLEYKSVEFDKKVSFPFSIPNGFEQIVLNE